MQFIGTTIKGHGVGKQIGTPTINVDIEDVPEGFEEGIYACWVEIDDAPRAGALHVGPRPAFHDTTPSCEVHILDYKVTTQPPEITIDVVQRLRDVQNFDSPEKLQEQIARDIDDVRAILGV